MGEQRCLLMGCGGIGGILAARLLASGTAVSIVTHNPAIAAAINARGLTVRDEGRVVTVPATATVDVPDDAGRVPFVLLATQPTQVEEAARAALAHLAPDGAMVCLQNGLCEQRVAAIAGGERTLGAIVAWGGSMDAPAVYDRTSEGGFTIGRLDGSTHPRLDQLRAILSPVGPVDVTTNLRGARWSKLAINCAISSLGTIGGDRLGVLLRYRFIRRLALEVMTEAVAVARSRGVHLEKVAGTIDLDWVVLAESERAAAGSPSLLAKHALLLAVGTKFRRLRSSMLQAIERGREPAVDYLNGEVVTRGHAGGIPVPMNERVQRTIHAIAARRLAPGIALLRALYDESRAVVGATPRARGPRTGAASPPPA